jgi:hypothetical protein
MFAKNAWKPSSETALTIHTETLKISLIFGWKWKKPF